MPLGFLSSINVWQALARPQQSLLQRLVGRTATHLARWLLTPRLRQAARVRDQLVESLAEVVQPSIQGSPVAVAIVEAAMALSLADGSFGQEEWELYSQCLERLNLSDQQRQDISLHGSPDLVRISASLAGLEDPSHRLAIAQTFCLFAAADGQVAGSEIGILKALLLALGHPELENDLPGLCSRYCQSEAWWERQRAGLGEWILRRASPHRRL